MNAVVKRPRPRPKIGSNVEEELYYISHIIDSLGVNEGFHWLARVDATRRVNDCQFGLLENARELDRLEGMYDRRN